MNHLKFCTNRSHVNGYSCARCRQTYCMTCDHASSVEMIKTVVRYCPDWRCQREKLLEDGLAPADPKAKLMFATLRRSAQVAGQERPIEVGDLVLVEVPRNCSIHYVDAERLGWVVSLAEAIGAHWRDQGGVNATLLDRLAEITVEPIS